jgi:hypothetical protein
MAAESCRFGGAQRGNIGAAGPSLSQQRGARVTSRARDRTEDRHIQPIIDRGHEAQAA